MPFLNKENLFDRTILRILKFYPLYFVSFNEFNTIRNFTDQIENLFLADRN